MYELLSFTSRSRPEITSRTSCQLQKKENVFFYSLDTVWCFVSNLNVTRFLFCASVCFACHSQRDPQGIHVTSALPIVPQLTIYKRQNTIQRMAYFCIMSVVRLCCGWFCFFFFQAEDGIRDDLVTGVQTCALPISHLQGHVVGHDLCFGLGHGDRFPGLGRTVWKFHPPDHDHANRACGSRWRDLCHRLWGAVKIGRASCRERV